MAFSVLTINPGSTSTKLARFEDEACVWQDVLRHAAEELAPFGAVSEQLDFRLGLVRSALAAHDGETVRLDAVVGRGGIIDPLPGGTYRVDPVLVDRLRLGRPWDHPSNLGGVLAFSLAEPLGIPAFIVDPVCVDEMAPEAKITGLPELPRPSLLHALNVKAMVRRAARDLEKPWNEINCVVVHLGGRRQRRRPQEGTRRRREQRQRVGALLPGQGRRASGRGVRAPLLQRSVQRGRYPAEADLRRRASCLHRDERHAGGRPAHPGRGR